MKQTVCTWIGVAMLASLSATAQDAPPIDEKVREALKALPAEAKPEELRRARNGAYYALLPNGAELIVQEKRTAPVVAVQAWVRTGAIHETEWLGAGMSHFCEHLLFKGTAKYPTGQLDQIMRGAGADDNAYTSSDRTVYHATGSSENFATLFDALSDMVMHSTFPAEEVTKEHAVVVKEIERSLDDPDSALWDAFQRTLYQEHPYRVPVLGYPDRFAKVTREEVWAYYQRRYAPQLTTFVAAGDLSAAEALPLMAKAVAGWARKSVAPVVVPEEPPQVAPRRAVLAHPLCEMPKFQLAFPTVSIRHPDLYALDVLASILGSGRSSRLYKAVQDEKQLVHEIECWNYTPDHPGMFSVGASMDPEKIEAARAAIWDVLKAACATPPTPEELARAQRKVAADHIFQQMTAEGVASALGNDWHAAGDLDFSQTYSDGIGKVTAEDVLAAAQKYLIPQRENFVLLLPEGVAAPAAQAAEAGPAQASGGPPPDELKARYPELAAVERAVLAGAPTWTFTFKNGLRAVLREDRSIPALHASLVALGGLRLEPVELPGAGNLLAEMLDRGCAAANKEQLAAAVENLGAKLETFGGSNTFGLNLRALKSDAPRVFDLAVSSLLEPTFPEADLEKARDEVLAKLKQQDEYIWSLNNKVFRPLLWGAHPYARHALGTPESVAKLTSADLKSLHARWVRPDGLAVAFVGDADATQALDWLSARLAKLPKPAEALPAGQEPPGLAGAKEGDQRKPGLQGAVLTLGFRTVDLKHPDRVALDLLAAVLEGLGGRLGVKIREEQGLAYAVGAMHQPQLDGGSFMLYVQTDPQNLKRCLESFWEIVNDLRAKPMSAEELLNAQQYLAGQEGVQLQELNQVAQRLALAQLYGEGTASVFTYRDRVRNVTLEQLHAAILKYLSLEHYARATVQPPEGEAPAKAPADPHHGH
ncbi:MAG: insulinase family protein [Planctomycetes bacterium]|nr:insulinase family protein [Planctomycetota bacterium]